MEMKIRQANRYKFSQDNMHIKNNADCIRAMNTRSCFCCLHMNLFEREFPAHYFCAKNEITVHFGEPRPSVEITIFTLTLALFLLLL
jgi:hypothetical protein